MKFRDIMPVCRRKGEVGIEVELEGAGLRNLQSNEVWNCEHDGSLRGDSVELVLARPCLREDVRRNLLLMKRMLHGTKPVESFRAGIHVHINVQELDERELTQFIILYYIFEDCLLNWCGEDRKGNLFCLSANDAGFVIERAVDAIKEGAWHMVHTDRIRYAALNLKALCTYGSLEFRAMRSTPKIDLIEKWVNILLAIKDEALTYESPSAIVERFSIENSRVFFDRVLGDFGVEYNRDAMMKGMRNAQIIAYCRPEWSVPFDKDIPVPEDDEDWGYDEEDNLERMVEPEEDHFFELKVWEKVHPRGTCISVEKLGEGVHWSVSDGEQTSIAKEEHIKFWMRHVPENQLGPVRSMICKVYAKGTDEMQSMII